MALCRIQLQCLVIAVSMHLYAVHCYAQPPIGTTLSVCDYTLNNRYVMNTIEPSTVFPMGYVSCVNATGSDKRLCEICSCRENKVGKLAAGVTVTGAVCVGSGDAITCVGQEQEYCDCNDSAGCSVGTAFLRDGLSDNEITSDGNIVLATDSVSLTNGSDTSAENNSTSRPSLSSNITDEPAIDNTLSTIDNHSSSNASLNLDTNIDTSISVIAPEPANLSIDTDSRSNIADSHLESGDSSNDGSRSNSTDSNTADTNASIHTSIDTDRDSILKPASPSIAYGAKVTEPAVENDNTTSSVVGTGKPSQTDVAHLTDQNIRSQENGSSLGTNSGSASNSSWSGERLITVLSTICGIGVVAAIAVFVAIRRRGQSKKDTELGTPTDDHAKEGSSIVTPTNYGDHGARYYSEVNRTVDSFKHTPLAAIAVIGFDDAILNSSPSRSNHQYRSYSGAERNASENTYARTDSYITGQDVVVRDSRPSSAAIQQRSLVSNCPSVSVLISPTCIPIFDTSYSRESFSSDMSSQFESPSDELFRDSGVSFDFFHKTSCDDDSDSSTNSRNRQAPSEFESEENAAGSSVSSLDNVQYDFRDTEASEHMRESEMNTDSSRIAISFDMDSYHSEGL
ncbi:unnamed protein product [Peronospora destructor]|uniref:Mid2 domain-containing protein n=1 Tax=Peronospora destructor TaxID=86335 RepID=A0AAV0TYX7_9STRA|nr:unnamed protein product [Peronospora destructor]